MTCDAALVLRARGGDQESFEQLHSRHRRFIHFYANLLYAPGADHDDLYQEGAFGLYKAVRDYQPGRGGFQAFANGCIERQIITAVKTATRNKHTPLNERLSTSQPLAGFTEDDAITIEDSLAFADMQADPAVQKEMRDELEVVTATVKASLTLLEKTAILGIANGLTYDEISVRNDISFKQIDNAAQRARQKIAAALEAA